MTIFNALLNLSELKELYSGKPVCVCPLYNGVINTPKTFEAAGNPITIPEYKSLVKLTTSFSPKQAGTGDPSPENVRPISGYDSVAVTRNGQNFLKFPYYSTSGPSVTYNGIDAQVHEDGKLSIHGTTAESGYNFIFQYENDFFIPPGKYYIDVFGAELPVGSSVLVYNHALGVIANSALNQKSFTLNEGTGVRVYINSGESGVQFNIDGLGVILCVQSAPTAFIPYTGATATLTLPETIYGGTVDAVTGAGSKTWGFIASYNGESLPGEWISDRDVYAPGTTPTTGAQVAYKLATPKSFKVSQVTIPSLKGENYFFTNGENMDIIYKKESFWG